MPFKRAETSNLYWADNKLRLSAKLHTRFAKGKKHMKTRISLSFLLIAALVVPTSIAFAALSQGAIHFRLPANAAWVNSGFSVEAGQEVSVSAYGEVITAPIKVFGHGSVSDPDGQVWNLGCGQYDGAPPPCAMNDAPYGALVGKVGPSGEPFLIGDVSSFTASTSGDLYLAVNDNLIYYSDNYGNFMVFFNP